MPSRKKLFSNSETSCAASNENGLDEIDKRVRFGSKYPAKWSKSFTKPELLLAKAEFAEKDVFVGQPIPVGNWVPEGCTAYNAAVKSRDSSWRRCAVIFGTFPNIEDKLYFFGWYTSSVTQEKRAIVELAAILRRESPEYLIPKGDVRLQPRDVVLGRYLGGLAYSVVHQAVIRICDKSGNEYWNECAIKLYNKSAVKGDETLNEFVTREIDCMRAFVGHGSRDYPLAVKPIGVLIGGDYDEQRGVAMRLELGGDLSKRQKDQPLWNFEETVTNTFSLSHALCHLHSIPLHHLDIKPANIFYHLVSRANCRLRSIQHSPPALPILGDLGICSSESETSSMGAIEYQPPYMNGQAVCSSKVDTYSLALVIAENIMSGKAGETRPRASDIEVSNEFIFQLLPGFQQILCDAVCPRVDDGITSEDFFDRLTSLELIEANQDTDNPYGGGLLAKTLKGGKFITVIRRLRERIDAAKATESKIPLQYVDWLESALRRLMTHVQGFRKRSKQRQSELMIRSRRYVLKWCPKLHRLSHLLPRFGPALPSSATELNQLEIYLLTAADCLLVYAFANYIMQEDVSELSMEVTGDPMTTLPLDTTAGPAISVIVTANE